MKEKGHIRLSYLHWTDKAWTRPGACRPCAPTRQRSLTMMEKIDMNAPLPEHIRRALETVTLDDNPRRGLRHNYVAGGNAARSGFGVERACEGGLQ